MPPPFVVFALPRSRSYWLSKFLSYGGWHCGHDELVHCRSLDDVTSWLAQPLTGTVETAAAPFWRLLPAGVRIATLRRPVADVVASYARTGLAFDEAMLTQIMTRLEHKLDQIEARLPDVLRLTCADLATEAGCAMIFEHCLGLPHDRAWWAKVAPLNLQIDMSAMLRYFAAHRPQLEALARKASYRIVAGMQRTPELDGILFRCEPDWDTFYREGHAALLEHMAAIDLPPEGLELHNLPELKQLADRGDLQMLTARSNGRVFGYLLSIVGRPLDKRDKQAAFHTAFFASPLFPGLGMALQRQALCFLRERGVSEVQMRVGHRGDGPRLGAIYRRLGAEPFGELYRRELGVN